MGCEGWAPKGCLSEIGERVMAGSELEKLVQLALSAGASRAKVIDAADILVVIL